MKLNLIIDIFMFLGVYACFYMWVDGSKTENNKIQEQEQIQKQSLDLSDFPTKEVKIIMVAAKRNDLEDYLYPILFAIRKAENGGPGLEFGIMNPKANTFNKQAGWCAATVQKNYIRWIKAEKPTDFITFLGKRYCPTTGNLSKKELELNKFWIKNIKYWSKKINNNKENKEWS